MEQKATEILDGLLRDFVADVDKMTPQQRFLILHFAERAFNITEQIIRQDPNQKGWLDSNALLGVDSVRKKREEAPAGSSKKLLFMKDLSKPFAYQPPEVTDKALVFIENSAGGLIPVVGCYREIFDNGLEALILKPMIGDDNES